MTAYGNLETVTHPDTSQRTYQYEDANDEHNLTGIVDENNNQYAEFQYNVKDQATLSRLAGGIHETTIDYPTKVSPGYVYRRGG